MSSWGKETLTTTWENVLRDHTTNHKWKRGTLGDDVNISLQLTVSDENKPKTKSIDLSSFELQFLSRYYNTQKMTYLKRWQPTWLRI
jgi:hypothetical protein